MYRFHITDSRSQTAPYSSTQFSVADGRRGTVLVMRFDLIALRQISEQIYFIHYLIRVFFLSHI